MISPLNSILQEEASKISRVEGHLETGKVPALKLPTHVVIS